MNAKSCIAILGGTGDFGSGLAKRWLALVTLVTGGDPGIYNSLRTMYENEDNVMGTDTKALRPKMEYILKAAAAAGIKHPGQ